MLKIMKTYRHAYRSRILKCNADTVSCPYNPSTCQAEAGVQGDLLLYSEFEYSLGFMSSCLIKRNIWELMSNSLVGICFH